MMNERKIELNYIRFNSTQNYYLAEVRKFQMLEEENCMNKVWKSNKDGLIPIHPDI